jgi:leader peptidase (prepilin peptidase)/N-methyltransferase
MPTSDMPHWFYILFVFTFGACIGSFLNVLVYRLPNGISLISPASHCPNCQTPLAWYDNIPVLGWIFLRGKCRYCKKPISPVYPIVETVNGLLFAFYYYMFFVKAMGPPGKMDWPIYGLYMVLISGLLAASLIDAELFIIPAGIPWWIAALGVLVHATTDTPQSAGSLIEPPFAVALSAGTTLGLIISILLLQLKILPLSFPQSDLLEVERAELEKKAKKAKEAGEEEPEIPAEFPPAKVRQEIRKEMLFLMPPMALGGIFVLLYVYSPAIRNLCVAAAHITWLNAGLGAILGGLFGGFIVWLFRILGSYALGKEAMGLGDVHLMVGIGTAMGAGAATVTFFLAPFAAIVTGIYLLIAHSRRQLPLGPYLSLAAAVVMLFYAPIATYLQPSLIVLVAMIRSVLP